MAEAEEVEIVEALAWEGKVVRVPQAGEVDEAIIGNIFSKDN